MRPQTKARRKAAGRVRKRARGPQGVIPARLRDHPRQVEERLQIEGDLHATLHVRDIHSWIVAACCSAAARARERHIYIYVWPYCSGCNEPTAWRRSAPTSTRRRTTSVPVSTREYPLSGSAPTAWRRAAPTSTRRGSRRARPGRPSCSTSTCEYSQCPPSRRVSALRSGPARLRSGGSVWGFGPEVQFRVHIKV